MTGALILIVEDNDKNRKLVRDVLTFMGYTTIEWRRFGSSARSRPLGRFP